MQGKADYKPREGFENAWHVIGPGRRPVHILRKKDVPGLFTGQFWTVLNVWKAFNAGLGLPGGVPWDEADPDLMIGIMAMENHYKNYFSNDAAARKHLEGIFGYIEAYMKARSRR